MRILGIETSCDETAVCLIEASGEFGPNFEYKVLGNALYSQIEVHASWGGVYPNLAKREHARNLVPLLEHVLEQSDKFQVTSSKQISSEKIQSIKELLNREPELFEQLEKFLKINVKPEIDAIAVTSGPGLEPALWVGVNFAKALSSVWNIPIVATNHLEGHIAMALMSHGSDKSQVASIKKFEFPALALLISGGHTELDLIEEWPKFKTIGETRDDAVGEAFDKTARLLGIPYPGGGALSELAKAARALRLAPQFKLPRPMLREDNFDFSFSGLKTAVRRAVENRTLSDQEKMEIALEFENAVADVLVEKTKRAADEYSVQTVVIGSGVSANEFLKQRLSESLGIPVLFPGPGLSTDNALMIALAGYFHALKKEFMDPAALKANGNWRLGTKV